MAGTSRRLFIKLLGASLGATLVGAGNKLAWAEEVAGAGEYLGWRSLQAQWFLLEGLTGEVRLWDHYKAKGVLADLKSGHQSILDDLVAAGELKEALAPQLQMAYEQAVEHVWRLNNGASCYEPPPLSYEVQMMGREELVKQKALLQEAAKAGALSDETRAAAERAIERDLYVFDALSGTYQEDEEKADALFALFQEANVEASPEAMEAAKLLVKALSAPLDD